MKRILIPLSLALLLSTPVLAVDKASWLQSFRGAFPVEVCKQLTQVQDCRNLFTHAMNSCLVALEPSIPDPITDNEQAVLIGQAIGTCAGQIYATTEEFRGQSF